MVDGEREKSYFSPTSFASLVLDSACVMKREYARSNGEYTGLLGITFGRQKILIGKRGKACIQ